MRKRSAIWQDKYQEFIVRSYNDGVGVSEILRKISEQGIKASEFTVRAILKENGIKAVWKMPVRKPQFWNEATVNLILDLRNRGLSFSEISRKVAQPDGKMIPKSTIVRIVEKNQERVTYQPYKHGDAVPEEIINKIVKLYKEGNTIKNILADPEISSYALNSRVIRSLLKERKIALTGKKGNLRRWPEELQKRVVDLHLQGLTFEEIKKEKEIAQNNPTDYAIRKILKNQGVITRRISTYKESIDENRFRGYRDNRLRPKDVAIIHKHLAYSSEGRELMIKRMKLDFDIEGISISIPAPLAENIAANLEAWKNMFNWAVQYIHDDGIKKGIFQAGIDLGNSTRYLLRAIESGDKQKQDKAWKRMEEVFSRMEESYTELLDRPWQVCGLKDIDRKLCK